MGLTYFNWSSGKDSALALYQIQKSQFLKVSKLVTTVNAEYDRVSMHGLRIELLEQQAQQMNIPLHKIFLPGNVSMKQYDSIMVDEMNLLKRQGFTDCIFGDIFLEDLKAYREAKLHTVGITAHFPLWKKNTKQLMESFIEDGFKAITVCVNANYLDDTFCGRIIDEAFINELPANVDPCGENGEFHTFVFDGPIFSKPVDFEIGEKVLRTYELSEDDEDNCFSKKDEPANWDNSFWYCDLLPK
ncbi:diphthine--ammonia ligase [Aquimarina brevivitae]|uniref:Uncharacterized protein (TIGR00290 family) n=1 Tax=Aquimarina brevivitae TaxID=323412 RepID=A0A4Q7P309_9FLAO|nr:diphthine--ammonia ligase [Aquimarina brevivitae]RZS93770.1 uncharacterized protein (TIGR00290 family) [Aquimarina brevivitae]